MKHYEVKYEMNYMNQKKLKLKNLDYLLMKKNYLFHYYEHNHDEDLILKEGLNFIKNLNEKLLEVFEKKNEIDIRMQLIREIYEM